MKKLHQDAVHVSESKGEWPSADPEGGQGIRTPCNLTKIKGFLEILVRILLREITKLPSQHSMLGYHSTASERPFCWRAKEGPLKCYLDPLSPHQLKKKNVGVGLHLTKFSGSPHRG